MMKLAEDNLKQEVSAEWFRSVFECINDAVFIHDIDTGTILEVNQRAGELYDCRPEDMKNLSVAEISANVPPYTQDEARQWMHKAANEGPQLFEWQACTVSGQVFWVEVNMRKAEILGVERLVGAVRDISKRKRVETELRRSEERFRVVLGNTKDPVYCLSLPTLTYDYISPAVPFFARASGYSLRADADLRLHQSGGGAGVGIQHGGVHCGGHPIYGFTDSSRGL